MGESAGAGIMGGFGHVAIPVAATGLLKEGVVAADVGAFGDGIFNGGAAG